MNSELYCIWADNYIKQLTKEQTERCEEYPNSCNPEECECCEIHCYDENGNRID